MENKTPPKPKRTFTLKSHQIPVTQEMLYGVRDELVSRLNSHDRRFDQMESKISSEIDRVIAAVHRNGVLIEEQRAQNLYVLDGISNLSDRVEKIEERLDKLENK